MPTLQEGDRAPDFELSADEGRISLRDLGGAWVVLYFYPRDFTGGCTQEACDFRDALAADHIDATVLGVSPDDVDSHRSFREAHGLSFPLLADEDHAVAKAYGVYGEKVRDGQTRMGIIRSTFVIDPDGVVRKAFYGVEAGGHAADVAEALRVLRS
ncbi:MAG: peroxiredoxin [Trueperaceae bacterium]|nr:peroxiredoxin [Trueperaceae bacterium]